MLIVLAGLPGAGKTTIARELAPRLHAVHVRIDTIEHAIRQSAAHSALPIDDSGYLVGYGLAEDNLRLGHLVIADSVNPWPQTREAWRHVARQCAVPVIEVAVICSDHTEHRRRIESRTADLAGFELPAWPDVVNRDYRRSATTWPRATVSTRPGRSVCRWRTSTRSRRSSDATTPWRRRSGRPAGMRPACSPRSLTSLPLSRRRRWIAGAAGCCGMALGVPVGLGTFEHVVAAGRAGRVKHRRRIWPA